MAQTPTDPTKAQVWITKGIDDLDFEFYFPQGPKGDAGGFTLGTALDNTLDTGTGKYNLNDVLVSGIYRLTATVDGLLLRNYPRNYDTGILEVFERVPGQTVIQVWHCINQTARIRYERTYVTGTWSPWRLYTSTRVDQTAGRAIYMFDDVNGREQLVYGDTGWRQLPIPAEWSVGKIQLRRTGHMVTINFVLSAPVTGAAESHGYPLSGTNAIPIGFRPIDTVFGSGFGRMGSSNKRQPMNFSVSSGGTAAFERNEVIGADGQVVTTSSSIYGTIAYPTVDTWPTTLPGTSIGSVPNI